ncbi:MAG: hypothetical protein RSC43_00095 [Clostridia bacterium]
MILRVGQNFVNTLLLASINQRIGLGLVSDGDECVINMADYLQSQIFCNCHKYLADPFTEGIDHTKYSTSTSSFCDAYKYMASVCQGTCFRKDETFHMEFFHAMRIAFIEILAASLTLENTFEDVTLTLSLPLAFIKQMDIPIVEDGLAALDYSGKIIIIQDFNALYEYMLSHNEFEQVCKRVIALGSSVEASMDLNKFYNSAHSNPSNAWKRSVVQAWLAIKNIYAFGRL